MTDEVTNVREYKPGAPSRRLRVRRARPEDAAGLSELAFRSKASNGYGDAFMQACREELTVAPVDISRNAVWVVEADRQPAGFAVLSLADGVAEVEAMFVDPNAKRGGIGRALWDRLEAHGRDSGVCAIELDADPAAVVFYAAMGCEIIGEAPSESIAGRMLPRMRKVIS